MTDETPTRCTPVLRRQSLINEIEAIAREAINGDSAPSCVPGLREVLWTIGEKIKAADEPKPPPVPEGHTRFYVCVQQYVELTAKVPVDIENGDAEEMLEDAVEEGLNIATSGDCEAFWGDGDDCHDAEVYAVMDAADELVWER